MSRNDNTTVWVVVLVLVLFFLFGGFGFGMMGWGGSMMGNLFWGSGFSFAWIFMMIIWVLVIILLVLGVIWLVRQLQNPVHTEQPRRRR